MTTATATELELDEIPNGTFTEPQVMHSQAGHYVGTSRMSDGMWSPYDRYSDYMPTSDLAQAWLDRAKRTGGL